MTGPAALELDEVIGLVMRATVPGVALGEIVRIDRRGREPLAAEVVGFRGEQAVLLPALCGCAATTRSGRACRGGLG
jgi:flagellar biosynthesis/type III secretory pathway ATPase